MPVRQEILVGSTPKDRARTIRFLGSTPLESRDFISPDLWKPFDEIHEVPALRDVKDVFAKLQEWEGRYVEMGNNRPPRTGDSDPFQHVYGVWSGLWNSLDIRRFVYPPEVSLKPVPHIIARLSDSLADKVLVGAGERIDGKKDWSRQDIVDFLDGQIAGFEWVLGRNGTIAKDPDPQVNATQS